MTFPLSDPAAIVALLLGIVGLVLFAGELPYIRGLFKYVPAMFWIYFIPMLVATAGLFPPEKDVAGKLLTPTYGMIGKYCLPACLVLLLLSVDIKAMVKLGGRALGVMLAGSLGILLGGPVVLLLFKPFAPEAIRNDSGAGWER
jgi:uncharacterized membrane protein